MSAQFAGLKSYPVSVANQDVPSAWLSNSDPRVASANKKIVQVSSSTGTQTSGGLVSFILPANLGAGMLVSGSAYIKFTVTVTQSATIAWAFKQYGSASSVVNRMTLLSSGAITEQILNYNKLYSALLLHASNPSFAQGDDKINQYSFNGSFSAGASTTVCIPVLLGAFNSKQHLPLFLMNSCQLNVDLDTVANSIIQLSTGGALTEYAVSSATLVFEQLCPDHAFEQGVKAMLGSRLYQMPINTFYNVRTAQSSSITQNIGLNCSSLKSILWATVPQEGLQSASHFTDGGQQSCRVFLDGQLAFAGNLDNVSSQFLEMNRALNTMWDSDRVSTGPVSDGGATATVSDITISSSGLTRAIYSTGAYLGGISTAKSSESGFSMSGVPVNSAVVEFVGTAGGTFYIFCALQQVITIDQQGTCALIR
jgi:hypothetical protein